MTGFRPRACPGSTSSALGGRRSFAPSSAERPSVLALSVAIAGPDPPQQLLALAHVESRVGRDRPALEYTPPARARRRVRDGATCASGFHRDSRSVSGV